VRLADTKEKDYALKFCGFLERPMGPDLIAANKFEVTVRKLSPADAQHGKEAISAVEAFGFPNYFDDQRFGSFVPEEGFLAERLLKGHFSGALKIYLSAKGNFFRNWKDWEACLESARREYEKKVFSYLAKNPKGFLVLLKQIPQEKMALYFSAYQAYLWNELLRRLIKEATFALRAYAGVCQDYLFYDRLREQDYLYLSSLALPTAAHNAQMPDGLTAQIYNRVLAENGIKKAMFNKLKIRQVYFKAVPRKAIVKPQNFSLTTLKDELYVQKQKIVLKFTLPRGSYATMLIKRLFAQ
jgi:tRNA pseudouridine13 synthase